MANITLLGASYADVPAVDLPKTGGGLARFHEVSGSLTITDNGTVDVSNLAEVVVALTFSTIHTGTSTPAASLGADGDIFLQV